MHEALEDERYLLLLLGKVQVLMQGMQEERIVVGGDGPGFNQEKVSGAFRGHSEVNHGQVPTVFDRDGDTASGRFQQVTLRELIDGKPAPITRFVDEAAIGDRTLLVLCR